MELQQFLNIVPQVDSIKFNQTEQMLNKIRNLYDKLDDPNISIALFKLSEHIMKLKAVNLQVQQFVEQCIKDIIRISVSRKFAVGTEALRIIFNLQAEYYKHNKLDAQLRFPLGYRHPLNYYEPQVGQDCDIVKPYISSTTYCGWTRGTIISKDNKKYLVKYANTQTPTQTKQQPFCAPLGTRTEDFQWRMNLNLGDQVDAHHKIWYKGTVVGTQTINGVKRVRVTFKIYNQNGSKVDKNRKSYDGFQDQQDQWYQVTSYRIQKIGSMSKNYLCFYSLTAQQFVLDDTYDLIFRKQYEQQKFRAIMRTSFTRSQSFLQFYQTFCDMGGNTLFLSMLQNHTKQQIDPLFNVIIVIANSSFLVPRMKVNQFLPQMLDKVIKLLYQNSKFLNPNKNEMAHFFIDVVAKRIMTLSQKHLLINQIRKRLTLDFLKMNMQKQMIALRMIYELINPMPRKYTQSQKKQVDQFLKKNNIFYQLIQPNTHEQILLRTAELIKYLLKNQLIEFKQIQYLWNIYPQTDLRGKSTVEKMISQISKSFNIDYTNKVIKKILEFKQSQLTVDNLALLRSLKDHKQLHDQQKLHILHHLWQIITLKSTSLTITIQEQVQKVFKSIIPTLQSNQTKLQLLKLVLLRFNDIKQLNNEFNILKQFIQTYPKKSNQNNVLKIQDQNVVNNQQEHTPESITEVVQFLKQQNIYSIIINIFNDLKAPEKMKNILQFTAFLFQHDKDNVNQIAKVFYDKMGPTDIFLQWAQNITQRAHEFFIWFFGNLQDISKFENLSNSGFDALKTIIFDVNIHQGNLKMIKKYKGISIQSQPNNKDSTPYPGPLKGPVQGPAQKPQTLTFLYLLKSPYECKGVKFLQQLLCVVKNSKVYDQIIKLIIQFFVNLDESIIQRTKQFREQFLMDIIQRIRQINIKNEYNQKIKLKIQISINLLQQLFSQTQKQGLCGIKPHFQCVEGQILKLKIQNHVVSNKTQDFKVQLNENSTLYTLKQKVAEIFKQNPKQLDVYKFTTPISDDHNGKTINDLHFFNEQSIRVMRKGTKDIPKKQLLSQLGQDLSPKFKKVVQKWFNQYKNQRNQMGLQQLKKLSSQCWKGSALKQISKLHQMLKKFDIGQKGYLNFEQFCQFFIQKASQNVSAVWRIINLSGYKNNLRYKDQPQEQISPQIYPRRILSNDKVYKVIFDILQNKNFQAVHLNVYRLLGMLQTDRNLKQQIKKNAKTLIEDQTSMHKLSYILQTVLSQILVNDEFFVQFYKNKGCEFIFHKLSSFMTQNKSVYSFDALLKTIVMPNMIKILNTYIFCQHSQKKLIRFIKKTKLNVTEMDSIVSQVKKLDQIINEKNQNQERLNLLRNIQISITDQQYYQLSAQIMFNLIENFNTDLLSKLTNQIVRMHSSLSISLNRLKTIQLVKGLKIQSLNFRRACQNLIFLYLQNNNNQTQIKALNNLLLQNLPQQSKNIFSNYFSLLQKVLQMYLDLKKDSQDNSQFIQLVEKLFERLFKDIPNQNRNALTSDKLLLGVLIVIKIIMQKRDQVKKAFKHKKIQLLQKCLFFYHPKDRIANIEVKPEMLKVQKQANHFDDYVKCKSQDTRKVLMEIIYYLHQVSAQQDPTFIDNYILPIFDDLPKQKRKFETKTLQVGLNNLGSTCYLNSMLQVLNAVAPFRNGIMQSKSQAPLVKEMKALFSYLYFSERQDYVPEQLLKAFAPPIIKGIQQDTTQFLNILFDQLQSSLKGTPEQHLLQQIFRGTQAAQMICHACHQKRQRKQTFFTYGVQIQGKYELNSALQGMHTGQLITDCLCQNCGQRADTTKRSVIQNVPNLFFVHLKRIVFNYDVFMNTKIHTRLQFPAELNFEPYTKQGLQLRENLGLQYLKNLKDNQQERKKFEQLTQHGKIKDYYKLKLKGIIVHSGGPQVGHYWAITKKQNGWVKFDDSRVSVFPHSSMQSQCFGGNFQSDQWGGMGSSTNAYVLLYEKQIQSDVILGQDENKRVIPCDKFQTFNTPQLYKEVWLDNHSLMLQNHLLRDSFCKQFIYFLTQMVKITPSNSKIDVISQTLYKVCFHSGQTGKLAQGFLQNVDQIQPSIFKKYVISDKQRTFDLLFHNNANVRQFTAVYLEKVFISTYQKGSQQDKRQVLKQIDEYLNLLHHDVAKNWLRIDGYLKLFLNLVTNSANNAQLYKYFLQKHLISYFIDFILEKSSPINIYPKKYSIGTKSNPAHFGYAIQLIFFLIKRSYGLTGQNYEVPKLQQNLLYHLSDNDVLCLSSIGFYQKMLKQRQNLQYLGLIIQRLSIKNLLFSQAVARVMLTALNEITDAKDEMLDICGCISKYLIITDQYWTNRAQFIIGYSSPYIFNDNLLSSLDQQRFVYYSTIEELFPIECLLAYCHVNRLRNPLAVMHILKTILEGCVVSQTSKEYLLKQKAPSYYHERYLDWVKPYINNVLQTLNLNKQKKQNLLKQIQICNSYISIVEQQKQPLDSIITGKILNQNIVDRFADADNSIQVVVSNVECYSLWSRPIGFGNLALDDQYLDNGRLNKKVTKQSNILCLFKQFNKPLAIKQAQQEAEDKELESLFDDCVYTGTNTTNTSTQPNKQSKQIQQPSIIIQQPKQQVIQQPEQLQKIAQVTQTKQQQVIHEVNIPGLQITPDYFRKLQIMNNSGKTKRVTLKFHCNQASNMIVPSKIYLTSTKKAIQTVWICKSDPKKGWGAVDYELTVDEKEPKSLPKSFKIYGGDSQQQRNMGCSVQPMEIQQQNQIMYQWKDNNPPANEQIVTEINCPVCTMLNLSTETNCEVCGSSLR